jgi:hypothetical protein
MKSMCIRIVTVAAVALAMSTVAAVLPSGLTVIDEIPLLHPQNLFLSPDGSKIYVQCEDGRAVSVIDAATHGIEDTIWIGPAYLMDMNSQGTRIYGAGSGRVEVVDLVARASLAPIPIPGAAGLTGVAASPDGQRLYVSDRGTASGMVHIIDTVSSTYLKSIVADPYGWPFLMGIDVAPDGSHVYVVSRKYSHLNVIDTANDTLVGTIPVSTGATSILATVTVAPNGRYAYVTNVQSDVVSVVDTDPASPTFHTEIAAVDTQVGTGLGLVSFTPDSALALVPSGTWPSMPPPHQLIAIDASPGSATTHTVVGSVPVGPKPWASVAAVGSNPFAYLTSWDGATPDAGALQVIGLDSLPISCDGFDPPLADGPVTARGNRALPLKARLFDTDGYEIDDLDLTAPPVLQVMFQSTAGGSPVDVTGDALPAGHGTDGNEFEYNLVDRVWQYNLKTKNYSAPGTYTITMVSGDASEYLIEPTCEATFERQ